MPDFIGKSAENAGKELRNAQEEELRELISAIRNQAYEPTEQQMQVLSHASRELHMINNEQSLLDKEKIAITPEALEAAMELSTQEQQPKATTRKVEPTTPQAEEPTPVRETPRLGGSDNE